MQILSTFLTGVLGTSVSAFATQQQQPLVQKPDTISQPLLGFGCWRLAVSDENTTAAVSLAIQTGYRQIDGAAVYGNEVAVGKGIADGMKKANITREELWVTSKLWNDHHDDPSLVEAALNKTLKDLNLDYLDLYLVHWPVSSVRGHNEVEVVHTWKSMVALPKNKVLNIGISNFSPSQIKSIISATGVKPFAHQLELHPYLQQSAFIAAHKALGIAVTAYSPLANINSSPDKDVFPPPLLKNDVMIEIANARNCTTAQVALAWNMGRGASTITKSSHEKYIKENFESQKCELQFEDLAKLRIVGRKYLKRYSNPSKSWGVDLFEGLDGT